MHDFSLSISDFFLVVFDDCKQVIYVICLLSRRIVSHFQWPIAVYEIEIL